MVGLGRFAGPGVDDVAPFGPDAVAGVAASTVSSKVVVAVGLVGVEVGVVTTPQLWTQ